MNLMVIKMDVMHILERFHALAEATVTNGSGTRGTHSGSGMICHLKREEVPDKIRGLMADKLQCAQVDSLSCPKSIARLLNAAGG